MHFYAFSTFPQLQFSKGEGPAFRKENWPMKPSQIQIEDVALKRGKNYA
jgi:hypothetical protein